MYITGELWYIINMKKLIIIISLLIIGFVCFVNAHELNVDYDKTIVAATLILEAGGEKDKRAMYAVYEVMHNRSIRRHLSYDEVCLEYKQFSCWNSIHTRATAFGIKIEVVDPYELEDIIDKAMTHPRWKEALSIVSKKSQTRYTSGATHYHADYVDPYWANSLLKTIKIDHHIFYK